VQGLVQANSWPLLGGHLGTFLELLQLLLNIFEFTVL
jgi:hypothetical protein